MKTIILLALVTFAVADEKYYVLEKVDMTGNVDDLKSFINCLIEVGPCTELHESYRVRTPECIQQACKKCTLEQKQFVSKFLHIVKTLPQDYENFRQKFDPENKYLGILETKLKKYRVE